MILDKTISHNNKVLISVFVGAVWIYFRSLENYALLPRHNLISVILVSSWIYLNYLDPLFLPIGLTIMYLYSQYVTKKTNLN